MSIAYLAWPVALYECVAPREEASRWYHFHMRQALWFGIISSVVGLGALLWPLVASIFIASAVVTIWLYAVAMAIDVVLLGLWAILSIRYAQRAGAGQLFDVPWVTRLTGVTSRKS